ncbi:PIN domain-containing protein [Phytoactinopolyspora limicola]|uniref:PIN domain-containing protein n=1 Tax=Phytoactinopolyspora limicola TaxID=2715536 RepID=UPI00140C164A|nr:PIN domain-containing protein [Phytoactinopolyspora limicola]
MRVVDAVLTYVDSSVLTRSYLAAEPDHAVARSFVENGKLLVTASFTVIEVTSTLVRASRYKKLPDADVLIEKVHQEVSADGPIELVRADPALAESAALTIVRHYALHPLEAMHLAVADVVVRSLAEPGEQIGFATYRGAQRRAAQALGYVISPLVPPPPPPKE